MTQKTIRTCIDLILVEIAQITNSLSNTKEEGAPKEFLMSYKAELVDALNELNREMGN